MLAIAIPVTLQNLITSSLNMIDTVMIGKLGSKEIAAVGLANQYFFLFILFVYGLSSGGSVFIAQFWGKKDIENIRKVLGIMLMSGCILCMLFGSIAVLFPSYIIKVFIYDPDVIRFGEDYLKIVGISYIFTTISYIYGFALRGIGQAKMPMIISAISLCVNTLLNYLLIFGKLGFPTLGVKGAAYGTLVARIVEMILMLWILYREKNVIAANLYEMLGFSRKFLSKFFATTTPIILNEGFWAVGTTIYSIAYGKLGADALAAVQITNTVQEIFLVAGLGLGSACSVMIGNKIGEYEEQIAIGYAGKFSILSILSGIVFGLILYLLSPGIVSLFSVNAVTKNYTQNILTVISIFITVKMFSTLLIIGILRGGGDTKFSFYLEMLCVWFVGIPMAFAGVLWWRLPIHWVVVLVNIEEIVKSAIGIFRVKSRKWINNIVEDMS